MKLLHLADLHIGKRVNEFNMIPDQAFIINQIFEMIEKEQPDGVLISGDIYDKSQPSIEAISLLDHFLTRLTTLVSDIFVISGNHDSPERLGFGSHLLRKNGLHIAGTFDGTVPKVTRSDCHGVVNIYLLPFIKPAMVRPFCDDPIESYEDAVRAALSHTDVNLAERNVLLAHQFVISGMQQPERSESEIQSIGGLDSVDISVFSAFDYVALGHLHGPQRVGRDTIRYAGSPLKYSFSESRQRKSATLLTLGVKGTLDIAPIALTPLHDLREIKGPLAELLRIGREDPDHAADYLRITLTDEEEIYDAIGKLRTVYPNLMALDFENSRSVHDPSLIATAANEIALQNPLDLFDAFYQMQNNNALSTAQIALMEDVFEQAGGDAK